MLSPGQSLVLAGAASNSFNGQSLIRANIGGIESIFRIRTRAATSIPDNFVFNDISNAIANTDNLSNIITISGMESIGLMSVSSGGQFRINGGAWRVSSAFVSNGSTVQLMVTSSAVPGETREITLSTPSASTVWRVTTFIEDFTPDAFSFPAASLQEPGTQGVISDSITPSGYNRTVFLQISGPGAEFSINNLPQWMTSGPILPGQSIRVRGNASGSFSGQSTITLTVGNTSGAFVIPTRPVDDIPDQINVSRILSANPDQDQISNPVFISGLDFGVGATLSMSVGLVNINDAGWVSGSVIVRNGDRVRFGIRSSRTFGDEIGVSITIGQGSVAWLVRTRDFDATPNPFDFVDMVGVLRNNMLISQPVIITGLVDRAEINISPASAGLGEFRVNSGPWRSTQGTVGNGDSVMIRRISSGTPGASVTTIITIDEISADWVITSM